MNARISARALNDLDCIFASVCARQSPQAANRLLEPARAAVNFLTQHPLAGPHPQWTIRHKNLRFWVISRTNYLIYYLVDEKGGSVERVLDGRRDVERIIELDREDPSD